MSLVVYCGKTPTPWESSLLEMKRRMGAGFIKSLSEGRGQVGAVLLFVECSLCPSSGGAI